MYPNWIRFVSTLDTELFGNANKFAYLCIRTCWRSRSKCIAFTDIFAKCNAEMSGKSKIAKMHIAMMPMPKFFIITL
jgi:hypothetical protein